MKCKTVFTGLTVFSLLLILGGCGSTQTDSAVTTSGETEQEHEALTMITYDTNYEAFEEALHEAYPEINIEFISYDGYDSTDYACTQLKAGDISDIFMVKITPDEDLQKENLIDLSGESFITNLSLGLLSDVTVDGAVYLMPSNYSFRGIYYNKTLFEEHNWEVPDSFEELEALIPQIEAAGVTVSECCTEYLGSSFAYFFDIAAPDYIATLDGQSWMEDYLNGDAAASGNLDSSVEVFQKWIDCGMLHVGETPSDDEATQERFREGNTAFLLINGNFDFAQNEDGTGDEYGILPYFSEDGSNNIIVTQVNAYYGLSKSLEDDPQKLEDALKVMEFMTTTEGLESLATQSDTFSPVEDSEIDESSPVYPLTLMIDEGKSMPLIYSGWENYVTSIGEYSYDLIASEITGSEFITSLDDLQAEVQENGGVTEIAEVKEDLTLEETAQLVGVAFAEETGSDCALISLAEFHGHGLKNKNGVNAKLYADVELTTNVICTFNPLGWSNTIKIMTLTGSEIKELAETGLYQEGDDTPYPYVLVTKDGTDLDDDTEYTVACVTESDENAEKGNLTDSGVVGQDALIEYLGKLGTITKDSIIWE